MKQIPMCWIHAPSYKCSGQLCPSSISCTNVWHNLALCVHHCSRCVRNHQTTKTIWHWEGECILYDLSLGSTLVLSQRFLVTSRNVFQLIAVDIIPMLQSATFFEYVFCGSRWTAATPQISLTTLWGHLLCSDLLYASITCCWKIGEIIQLQASHWVLQQVVIFSLSCCLDCKLSLSFCCIINGFCSFNVVVAFISFNIFTSSQSVLLQPYLVEVRIHLNLLKDSNLVAVFLIVPNFWVVHCNSASLILRQSNLHFAISWFLQLTPLRRPSSWILPPRVQ